VKDNLWARPPGEPIERAGFIERRFPFLSGMQVFPLGILFVLNAVDEFDRTAFFILAPEIRDSFGLSNTSFGVLVGLFTVLILIGGVAVGFIGDRFRRTWLVVLSGALWGSMTILTGLAPALWVLVIARIGSGSGRVANEAIHTSLLTDYYPQSIHGRIFGIHRAANPVGTTLGPLVAGTLAALTGDWRLAFLFISVPTFIAVAFAFRLKEPIRGATEDAARASEAGKEPPIRFARAWRWLFAVPSLKRLYVAGLFGAGAIFAGLPYFALFYAEEYGVGSFGRGLIGAAQGLMFLVGALIGGAIADRLRRKSVGRIAVFAATAAGGVGVGILLVGVSPVLGVALAGTAIAYLSIGLWFAPTVAVLTAVSPARIRSLAIGVGVMFIGCGTFLVTVMAGIIADGPGLGTAVTALAPPLWIASALYFNAARFVSDDAERALQTLAVEAELRAERLSAGTQAQIVCRGVDVAYDGVQVLFGVDFEVKQGQIVALLGTNGAGKSTLLRAISGAVHPVGGAIFFEGRNVTFFEPHETAAAGIAQMPGGRGVFPSLTVAENLRIAAWLHARNAASVRKVTKEVVELFPVLKERWDTPAGGLSGGEQQMLSLAQAFIARPKLLMVDELSLGLAPVVVEQLLETVKKIHARGTTVIIVEQSASLALNIAEVAYFMEKGEIRFSGPAHELAGRTDLLRSVFLEGAGRDGRPTTGDGRAPRPSAVQAASLVDKKRAKPVLEVKGLSKSFGGIRAVDDVSFAVSDEQILGMIGPNGAGKTTAFDLISGFIRPNSGQVFYLGEDVTSLSANRRARRGLGRSFQDALLFPSLTVAENLAVALERSLRARNPLPAALGLPHVRLAERRLFERADELIEKMGLTAYRDKFVSELSTGTRRIVDIACVVAHHPTVLILDEPSSGIAQAETRALGRLLTTVREDLGCSLLLIEHDLPLVSEVADELVALDLGRVIARGRPDEVLRDPAVVRAYLGTSGVGAGIRAPQAVQ
jgi:ABC-type branched-subunit amino acid transport system ATPase component/predicted MFS family arabinose efflux permease